MPSRPISSVDVKERHGHPVGELKRYHITGLGKNKESIDVRTELCSLCLVFFKEDLELNVVPLVRATDLQHLKDVTTDVQGR